MKQLKLIGLVLALAGLTWIIAQEIDDTQTATKTVVTVTSMSSVLFQYGTDGNVATVTATVSRSKDDGTGGILTKSGSRTFSRDEFLASGLVGATNLLNQLEKRGVNSSRTFLFQNTNLGS